MPKVTIPDFVLKAQRIQETAPLDGLTQRQLHNLERDITWRVRLAVAKRKELAQVWATTGKLLEDGKLELLAQLTEQAHFLVEFLEDNDHELARLNRKLGPIRKRIREHYQTEDATIARLQKITGNGKTASEKLALLEAEDDLTRPVRPEHQSQAVALPGTRPRTRRTV